MIFQNMTDSTHQNLKITYIFGKVISFLSTVYRIKAVLF